MAGRYEGKVVLITGASSGIGAVAARMFAQQGAKVVAVARREALLEQVITECRQYSRESFYLTGDVGERSFAEGIVSTAVERLGRLDILVNNAAVSKHKHIYHTRAEEAETVMRINFLSCVWTTFAAIPAMLRQGGGYIVNVSSFAAKLTPPREALYAASKAAMSAFTEGLWHDLAGSNIHAVLVHPGPIDTEIWLKEDEPPSYRGKKYPPEMVVEAIFDCIDRRRYEMTVPQRNPMLLTARLLRLALPSVLRWGMQRTDPVPQEVLGRARQRAAAGKRLGDIDDDSTRG
ncbi:MAG: SDR family NAD(P)-dependent oxidoreductase [Candidatus Binatia bacterium]|nr:SDR family NAD(P)-dependent oxidoreductase [Candidatus Binatia bacterium]